MINKPLVFALTSDFSGTARGKAFPLEDLPTRQLKGIGWTPTNVQITCFDSIAESPFGALGDLLLIPDAETLVDIDFEDGSLPERFVIGDVTDLAGEAWEYCSRSILKDALKQLNKHGGASLFSAFEHEFQIKDNQAQANSAYALSGFSDRRELGEVLMAALEKAGLSLDSFMKEYGANQYEVVVGPETGIKSADWAVILRELTRASAKRCGLDATFSPILDPDSVGNGVHIHMSFLDDDGKPLTYDPNGVAGMSALTGSFIAGILKYLDSIVALTAPSAISYIRLAPNRWSAAFNNLGFLDREAAVRICPLSTNDEDKRAKQYNFEFRAADAAASPYLALASVIYAGVQGIKDNLPMPNIIEQDLTSLSNEQLSQQGYTRLPQSLESALALFENNDIVRGWFPSGFADVYLAHKRGELACLTELNDKQRCDKYKDAY